MPFELMSLAEAARALGLSRGTMKIQALKGRLRAEKVGNSWIVSTAEVDRYRREHLRARPTVPPVSAPEPVSASFGAPRPAPKPGKRRA